MRAQHACAVMTQECTPGAAASTPEDCCATNMCLFVCRRLGGKVFTADSTKPPPRWPKVFGVCPASLPRDTEAALMAGDASFRLVHPSCRVTTYWMDKCIKVGLTPMAEDRQAQGGDGGLGCLDLRVRAETLQELQPDSLC